MSLGLMSLGALRVAPRRIGMGPAVAAAVVFLALTAAALAEPTFPPLTGRVVDQADLLSPAAERRIAGQLEAHEKATGNQVVVVTLDSLQGYDIADYGYRLGRQWGIGQKGEDNGLLLIVAPNERQVRIEVGYGLEGVMTDAASHLIIQNRILPQFRQGDYEAGIEAGVAAILSTLEGKAPQPVSDRGSRSSAKPVIPMILFFGFVVFFQIMRYRRGGRRRRRGGVFVPVGMPGRRGGFGGGGFGGGFSGGGGGFGGGGASGRW
jgi:uncharacterized protein